MSTIIRESESGCVYQYKRKSMVVSTSIRESESGCVYQQQNRKAACPALEASTADKVFDKVSQRLLPLTQNPFARNSLGIEKLC